MQTAMSAMGTDFKKLQKIHFSAALMFSVDTILSLLVATRINAKHSVNPQRFKICYWSEYFSWNVGKSRKRRYPGRTFHASLTHDCSSPHVSHLILTHSLRPTSSLHPMTAILIPIRKKTFPSQAACLKVRVTHFP